MQQCQKRIRLAEGGKLVTIFTDDGKNPEGLESFSVTFHPDTNMIELQEGGADSKPQYVEGFARIRLLHEATGEILKHLDEDSRTQ